MAGTDDKTTDLAADKRTPKCPGCKLPHSVHSFGDPGPYCTGTTGLPADNSGKAEQFNGEDNSKSMPPTDSGAVGNSIVQPAEGPDEDDEVQVLAKLNELKVAEEAIAKKKRVAQLKTDIAQAEQRLANLVDAPVVQPAPG